MAAWLFAWLGLSALMFVSKSFICSGELPGNNGNLFDFLQALLGFGGCAGVSSEFQFLLALIMWVPGLILIGQFVVPIVAGASANPIVGTIIGVTLLTGIIALIFAVV